MRYSAMDATEKRQFAVLFRQFLFRVVDVELLSTQADPEKLLGQMITVLLSFSMFVSIPALLGGRLPIAIARTFEHFFIATTMLVVGLFAVLSWDAVFPDRRDVLVLAPLPIRPKTVFLAKMAAIGAGLGLAVGALNGISGLLWPWMFAPPGSGFVGALRAMASFWITLIAGAMFIFGAMVTIQGVAARVLPRQAFLRISAALQISVLCLLVSVYVLEPSLERDAALHASINHRLLEWLPSYWFWGMFQQMSGAAARPEFPWLAKRACLGLAIAVAGVAATVLLSYFRSMRRTVEEPEISPGGRRLQWQVGGSAQRVVLGFAMRTMFRSRQHRMILSFYMGAAFGVMLILLRPAIGRRNGIAVALLAASVLMLCTASAAMRMVCSMPITLRANWIFRVAELRPAKRYLDAVRRSFLLLAVVPLWSGFAVLLFWALPWRAAAAHLVLLGLLGIMLTDVCIGGFAKIPFTCSYQPGKGNLQFAAWGVLVLLPLTVLGARYEWRQLQSAHRQLVFAGALVLPAVVLRWGTARRLRAVEELQFEDVEEPQIVSLDLAAHTVPVG